MAKYDKTILIGRLGEDPELKQIKGGELCFFTIGHTVFNDGVEEVIWHRVKSGGKTARVCYEHLHKGDLCCIEGTVDRRKFTKPEDAESYPSIIAERITFLSSRRRPENEAVEDAESVKD